MNKADRMMAGVGILGVVNLALRVTIGEWAFMDAMIVLYILALVEESS
jgi:hypothetical protein